MKIPIVLTLVIFIIGFIIGIVSINNLSKINNSDLPNFKPKIQFNFISILTNNLKVVLLMLAGSITFGFSTFINLIFNGFSLGMLISNAYNSGVPIKLILALTVPHGIFEIPAMLISAVAGFKIPYEIIQYLRDKKEKPITEDDIIGFLKLALISIILIIIAAFVEVYITPEIANYILT